MLSKIHKIIGVTFCTAMTVGLLPLPLKKEGIPIWAIIIMYACCIIPCLSLLWAKLVQHWHYWDD